MSVCRDCGRYGECRRYVAANESFSEVGGCRVYRPATEDEKIYISEIEILQAEVERQSREIEILLRKIPVEVLCGLGTRVDALVDGVEHANDCGMDLPSDDRVLYEAVIRARAREYAGCCLVKFAKYLIDRADGCLLDVSDLPELVKKIQKGKLR